MSGPMHCINHPSVETYLRCNRCEEPICPRCAVRTPVGYRCRNCISSQQRVFYAEFRPVHYLVAAVVALPLSLVAGWLLPTLGWLYTLVLGPLAGGAIAEAVRLAIGRRRGEFTWLVVCGCIVLGALPALFFSLLTVSLGTVLWSIVYAAGAAGLAYVVLRPGRRL